MTETRGQRDGARVLLDAEVHVHYGFLDLLPFGADATEGRLAYAGQANGLCGARRPGALSMRTGTHTGPVPVRIEAHPARPEVPDGWQDVVEVPFTPAGPRYALTAFDSAHELAVPAAVGRARWCADRMDDGYDGARMDADPVADRYLLQLWPAPPAPEEVVRSSSRSAAYWADVAQRTYPVELEPARRWVEPSRDEAIRRLRAERDRGLREPGHRGTAVAARAVERLTWGSARPSDRLRAIPGNTAWLAQHDLELAERLARASEAAQRAVAVAVARRAAGRAGIASDPEIAAALDAAAEGRTDAPPDRDALWQQYLPGPATAAVITSVGSGDPRTSAGRPPAHPAAVALDAVLAATLGDPAAAAVGAVSALLLTAADPAAEAAVIRRDLDAGGA
jgi:hypothetical protein